VKGPVAQLRIALGLLTRLPVALGTPWADGAVARAAWAFALVGAGLGVTAALVQAIGLWAGLPPVLAAVVTVGAMILVTGALHEDGLADTADALGMARERARALEIMRDSRIGTFGALALGLVTAIRVIAIAALAPSSLVPALVGAAALSRLAMVWLLAALPAARADGLSARAGRPGTAAVLLATALGVTITALAAGALAATAQLITAALLTALLGGWFRRRLGGHTGDTLGATQQLVEAALLTAWLAAGR
jgi:adenosylcobinamide-GDP ribazoletransferase